MDLGPLCHFASVTHSMASMVDFYFVMVSAPGCWLWHACTQCRSGYDWDMIYVSFVISAFGRHLRTTSIVPSLALPLFSHRLGKGNRPWLSFDEDLYTGASRAWLCKCISYYVYRSGARKKTITWGLEALVGQRIIDTTFVCSYMCYLLERTTMRSHGV